MENTSSSQYANEPMAPERPDFLKILCILSFVACGLMILLSSLGTICLTMDEAMIEKAWTSVIENSPELADVDPVEFMHNVGMVCVYMLIANIFSLIGVIMMWRLEKLGFFIYAIAELATNFFSFDTRQDKSYGGMIFWILIDLAFIVMYFLNLKHMNKKNNNMYVQSGS